jgi:hypothetical protein
MDARQVMFLPDYLMKSFDSSKIGDKQVVADKKNVVTFEQVSQTRSFLYHPVFIFSILLLVLIALTASKSTRIQQYLVAFDSVLFFLTGAMGILILFMWFGTEHVMCRDNLNVLWAWPTHAIFTFFMNKKKRWISNYFKLTAVVNSVLLLLWFFLPQHLNTALIPFVLVMIFRSGMRAYKKH